MLREKQSIFQPQGLQGRESYSFPGIPYCIMYSICQHVSDNHDYPTSTGKERDSETGFSYFGARYYDSDLMTGWLSVDPLADKYPNLSPYAYCAWNPIRLVDPDGRMIGDPLKNMKVRRNSISNTFGLVRKKADGSSRPHQGIDYQASIGTPVYPISNGKVVNTVLQERGDYGLSVTIQHLDKDGNAITDNNGNNIYSFYAHLSEVLVDIGDLVFENETIIGKTGDTGNARGMGEDDLHLHFEVRIQENCGLGLNGRLDPNDFVDTKYYIDKDNPRKVKMNRSKNDNNKSHKCIYK